MSSSCYSGTRKEGQKQRSVQPTAALLALTYHHHRCGHGDDDGDGDDDDFIGDDTDTEGCRENVDASTSVKSSDSCTRGFFMVTTNVDWDRAKYAALA